MHALTDPKKWSDSRLEDQLRIEPDFLTVVNNVVGEYRDYGGHAPYDKLIWYTFKNDIPLIGEERDALVTMLYQALNQSDGDPNSPGQAAIKRSINLIENIDIHSNEGIHELLNIMENSGYLEVDKEVAESLVSEEALKEFNEKDVFPLWYAHWQEKDIDKVRANIQSIYDDLESVSPDDPLRLVMSVLNRAFNGVHVTGSMLEYVGEIDPRVTKSFLKRLSNMDTSKYDRDLAEMGIF